MIRIILTFVFSATLTIFFLCTRNDTLYTPPSTPGVSIKAFVYDTTGVDTSLSLKNFWAASSDSISDSAGEAVTLLGFLSGDSASLAAVSCEWTFGDGQSSAKRIAEHRYMADSTYHPVFTLRDNAGFSISNTVTVKVLPVNGAGVEGFALRQGKGSSAMIKVEFVTSLGVSAGSVTTDARGFYKSTSPSFGPGMKIRLVDSINTGFSPESLTVATVMQNAFNLLDTIILQDRHPPQIWANEPSGFVNVREPIISAFFADTGSGISPHTFGLAINGKIIPDSLMKIDTAGFSYVPNQRLPDGLFTLAASIQDSAGNKDSLKWSFKVDGMKLTILTPDTTVRIHDTLKLRSLVSNVYSKVTMYKWDFDGNGTWDDSLATTDTLVSRPHVYTHDTVYNAIVYCRDDSGMVKIDTVAINVGNLPPVISSIRPDTTISIKDSIQLFGVAHDPDGTIKEYAWDFNGDGTFEFTSATQVQAGFRYNTAGIYKAVLRVTDDDNKKSYDTATITVLQDAPVITASTADTVVSIKDTIHLHASATVRSGTIVKWEWDCGNTGKFVTTSKGDTAVIAPATAIQPYTCVVRVTDSKGNMSTATVTVKVLLDAPVIDFLSADTVVNHGGTVLCSVYVQQQFGTMIVEIDTANSGTFKSLGGLGLRGGKAYSFSTGSACTWDSVKVRITDDDNNVVIKGFKIQIRISPPTILKINPDTTIAVRDSVTFYLSAIDSFGSITQVAWDFDGNGVYDWTSSTIQNTGYRYPTTGIFKAVLRLTDECQKLTYDTVRVTVVQDVPVVTFISGDTIVDHGGMVRCSVYVQQQFGTLTIGIDSANSGNYKSIGSLGLSGGESCSFSTGNACAWDSVKVRVTDSKGNVVAKGFRVRIRPRPLTITSIDSTVNTITVHFNQTQESDFVQYRLYRNTTSAVDTNCQLWTNILAGTTISYTTPSPSYAWQPRYYRVYQEDSEGVWSAGSNIVYGNIINSPPPTPTITFPAHDGDSLWPVQPICWTKCLDPNGQAVKYRVFINHNNTGYMEFATNVQDTSIQLQGYDMLGFKCKVIAYDSVGDSSGWSGERAFFIKGILPLNTYIDAIAIDAQGNKWFGTNGGGVSKFDGATWSTYTTANGLAGNSVSSIAIDGQGNKWFATSGPVPAGVSKFDGTTWTTYTTANGLASVMVFAIAIDGQGNKWFGTNVGVSKFDGATWTTYTTVDGLAYNSVNAIAIDGQGYKWFGTPYGVSKFDGATWTTYTTLDGLAANYVCAMAIDGQGNKWFGTNVGGVSKFDGTTWTTYTTSDGLVALYVDAIAIDGQGNKWFGTANGVSKFDGVTWTTYTTTEGLVNNNVNAIAVDGQGNKWFATDGGVSKFDGVTWTTYR
jgi:PKD domain